eukprot:CAMPEP_0197733758 /NCGR_PEP_ID=MMETSP1434-20131217/44070_1 /TAXON_ID=265543 /ORGANISM="Minutocellus polymorphus, Strain CCMP3303" /LENGTH=261 /DNA_ID=CAMNT_0043321151 /DNA_START=20 /DNA_END=805 /DNA_ORIENTATION=+
MPSSLLSTAAVAVSCAVSLALPSAIDAFSPHSAVMSPRSFSTEWPLGTSTPIIRQQQHSPLTSVFLTSSCDNDMNDMSRRNALSNLSILATASLVSFGTPTPANAATEPFVRQGKGYGYTFVPPEGFAPGKKPVQTHLDEVNFNLEGVPRYTFGVTVDPVRINSLAEFGKPPEVAARVVTAEVNRDGIFEVTLARDPVEDADTGAYVIDYISDGKRGKKHFVTRIFVKDQKLYVLTAQVKEDEYAEREKEIMECVKTFKPL